MKRVERPLEGDNSPGMGQAGKIDCGASGEAIWGKWYLYTFQA